VFLKKAVMKIKLLDLKEKTGIGFGTSGIRGLQKKLTDEVVYMYTRGFLQYLMEIGDVKTGGKVAIAGDLRESTDRIMAAVASAIVDSGLEIENCGKIPTPALAFYGFSRHMPSVMITGSHIPGDRNGIKFYLSKREVLKEDEPKILEQIVEVDEVIKKVKLPAVSEVAKDEYICRYINFFDRNLLKGKLIGVYGHSAVGRDIVCETLEKLGAVVIKIDYSGKFVAIDTEEISEEIQKKCPNWMEKYMVNYIVSTDGDSDRPMICDEKGNWLRSDILGILVAKYLNIDTIVNPISCNTAVDKIDAFDKKVKTKIGSPYVIFAMEELQRQNFRNIAGYEANGGFLLGTKVIRDDKWLDALPTRDAVIVLLSILAMSIENKRSIQSLVAELPRRFTASNSIKDIPTEISLKSISDIELIKNDLEDTFGKIYEVNEMDGTRIIFENGNIVHFRPSRNSPEFREYTESETEEKAKELSQKAIKLIRKWTK